MKLFIDILLLIVIGYYSYKFIQVMIKMRQDIILPTTNEEIASIRKYPQKVVNFPIYPEQKIGIIAYSLNLVFVIVMFFLGVFLDGINWSFYPLMTILLINSYSFINLFAVIGDGVLCGSHFVTWKKIKSFQFLPIDLNHRYYGSSKEVNDRYELRIKTKFYFISCIVTTDEMKEKLHMILSEHIAVNEGESALKIPR
ncbi:hypothetical protein SAMN05216232_3455 [Virgibacillus subterraneus]|uniref:DUF5673 domain-containing protein n=1 Tax=Virgibacillus subterraneus TaxID=621109 RepID=A0A1H9J9S8_9BACI|nr:hypothetical protein [Virgibacillus subterraneus]SEQ83547.1 hypothetical protein SAMN05216232_3455 [Virgibacillus subterraneus]